MTSGLLPQFRKEVRALLPWWAGIVGVMATIAALLAFEAIQLHPVYRLRLQSVSLYSYALGAIFLGALSVGHEYSGRTLPCLLTQPVSRQRLWLIKAAALGLILGLLALAGLGAFDIWPSGLTTPRTSVILWLPLLCGLCLAPWLTMVSRGTLPGVVFTAAVPVLLFIAGAALRVPYRSAWPIVGVLAIAAAFLAWRTFVTLEVAGDRSAEVDLVPWSATTARAAGTTSRHPYVLLLMKELRLQQISFVLAGVFSALWIVVSVAEGLAPDTFADAIRYAALFLYAGLISIMCGGLASAEERRLGTVEWQLLLPISHRAQWLIKMGTALALALLLAAVLPALLQVVAPDPFTTEGFHPFVVVLLCASALYVSSLSNSGVHATLATLPVMAAATALALVAGWPIVTLFIPVVRVIAEWVTPLLDVAQPDWRWRWYPVYAGWSGGAAVVLAFAGANHRTADHSRSRVLRQCAWLVALALATVLLWMLTELVMLEWRRLELSNS